MCVLPLLLQCTNTHTRRSDLKTGISFKIGHISGGRLTSPPCDRFAGVALLCKWRKKSLPLYGTGRIGRMFRLRNFVRTFECACACVFVCRSGKKSTNLASVRCQAKSSRIKSDAFAGRWVMAFSDSLLCLWHFFVCAAEFNVNGTH